MSVNFDAKLSLDISQFLSGVKKAEGALKGLEAQINRINSKNLGIGTQGGALGITAGNSMAQRRAEAAVEQALVEKMTKTQMNNAKVEWQSEMMRQKALDARLRDHQTISSLYDQEIALEQKRRRDASNAIKAQMMREQQNLRGIARERYALYDVAAAYAAVSAASIGTVTAVVGTAAQYERAFANVVRTTDFTSVKVGEAARAMRFELMQLANEIPVTFGQITEIATIGNQLGIAQGDLVSFTDTVAKFSATTDVTIQNAAMSFGRIGELLNVSDFNALGSAIAFAGVNAVATETQILAVTKEIATTAKQAKFAAPEVVGLATALGSLGIAPEAARGSIIRSFAAINAAITAGGDRLKAYASLAGMTSEQFASTWQEDGAKAFDALLKGLQAASDSGQNLDSVLRGLGVRNVRDIQTLQKLGDNYDVYAQSIRDANQAFEEGTFLSEAYGTIQETVAAKLGVIQNQVNNLLAGLGESTTGPVKVALDAVSNLLTGLQEFSRNPAGKAVVTLVVGLAALAAAVASVNAVVALGRAAMLAYATAMNTAIVNSEGVVIGLNKMATASKIAGVALKSIGIGFAITAVISSVSMLGDEIQKLTDKAGYLQRKAEELAGGFGGLQEALSADYFAALDRFGSDAAVGVALATGEIQGQTVALDSNNEAAKKAAEMQAGFAVIAGTDIPTQVGKGTDAIKTQNIVLGENFDSWMRSKIVGSETFQEIAQNKDVINFLKQVGFSFEDALSAAKAGDVEKYFYEIKVRAKELGLLLPEYLDINNIFDGIQFPLEDLQNILGGASGYAFLLGGNMQKTADASIDAAGATHEMEKNISTVARSLRTVIDYANDLNGIFSRIVELEFGKEIASDRITRGWREITKSASDAQKAIEDANREIQDLTADRSVLEYQLSVAERYGDELRAAKIRAELAKTNQQIVDTEAKLADAQDRSSKSLSGNSDAAIENRAAIIGIVADYEDYIETLAKLGRTPAQLAGDIQVLKKRFTEQALAAGFASSEIDDYAALFDQFTGTVRDAPYDVDIKVRLGIPAAQQAIDEFLAKNKDASVNVDVNANTEDAEKELSIWQKKYRELTPVELKKINTLAADGSLNSWLTLQREFGAPKVTGITADAADRKIQDWLNQVRILAAPRIDVINTLAADGRLNSWLTLQRTLGAPQVIGMTADAADARINNWLNQQRTLYPPTVGSVDHRIADMQINSWLNQSRKLSVLMQVNLDRSLIERQAQNMLNLARAHPVNSSQYNNYIELYRIMQNVARGMKQGGFVSGPGTSTSDSIPAMLSNGEYVIQANAVRAYGTDFMNALNRQRIPMTAGRPSGTATGMGAVTIAQLSPEDRALLRAAVDRPITLYADNTKIAQSANAGNQILSQRGIK